MGIFSEITLKDNYTATAKRVEKSAFGMERAFNKTEKSSARLKKSFSSIFGKTYEVKIKDVKSKEVRKNLQSMQSELRKTTGKDYKVSITTKTSGFKGIKNIFSGIKSRVINIKANTIGFIKAKKEAKSIEKELRRTTGKRHKVAISLSGGNSVLNKIKGIGNGLSKLAKGAAIGVMAGGAMLGAGAMAGGKALWNSGSELEKQNISMEHFLGGDKEKSSNYMKFLRTEANKTPFETGEVVAAGTRAIQIAGGDTKKGMELVKLAEDMAALNPEKTIFDAMEALADADLGEMERLKEFGFKGSKEEFDKAGGDLFKMKDSRGKTLKGMYEGGAEKLSKSGAGKMSTVMGNLKSGLSDSGLKMMERLSPALEKLIPISEQVGAKLPAIFDTVISNLEPLFVPLGNVFNSVKDAVDPMFPILGQLASSIIPILGAGFNILGSFISNIVAPAFQVIGSIITSFVIPAFQTIGNFLNNSLAPAYAKVTGIVKELSPVFKKIADVVGGVLFHCFDKLVGIARKLVDVFGGVAGAVKGFVGGLKDKINGLFGGKTQANATGTNYFSGGFTTINERGEELIQLARGTKIYPAGQTEKIIQKDIRNNTRNENGKVIHYAPVITINGANKSNEKIGDEIDRRLRRLAVNV